MLHNIVHAEVGLRVTQCGVCAALLTVVVLLIHSGMEARGAQNTNVQAMMSDGCTSISFDAATALEVGTRPDGVATGDFNGDGILDLAVANEGTNNVSIFWGTGTGSFIFSGSYAVGQRPQNVIAADLNKDGKLDLAVPNNDSNTVSILLGTGTGQFLPASNYDVGASPHPLAAGDFNDDGNIDLAVPNQQSHSVSILLGDGTGHFSDRTDYGVGAYPRNVAIADFNRDGYLDIATANIGSADISILLGTGNGSFLPATSVPVVSFPSFVESGDFNGDGLVDLAVASYTNQISILLGTGTGSFIATTNSPQVSGQMQGITIADLNGDGHLDLVTDNGSSSISIFLGTGTGSFGAETLFAVGSDSFSIAANDFNGDGRLDLAVANYTSNTVSVLLNTSTCNMNHPPVANAGPDQWVDEGSLVTLNGTASSDPDGNTLTYAWKQVGGVSMALTNAATATATFTAPFVGPNGVDLEFELTVDDGHGSTATDTIVIHVQNNPVASPDAAGVWIGLKNSDDQGTQFDLRTEVYKNGVLVTDGNTLCVTGVTRNPDLAKLVMVEMGSLSGLLNPNDAVSLKILTRIGTNPDGTKCSGPGGSHSNAVGLRLYYDSVSRSSGTTSSTLPYFLHSAGTNFYFDANSPTGSTSKYKDSTGINFLQGNLWKEIGTWNMTVP